MNTNYLKECVEYALTSKNMSAASLEEAGMRVFYNQVMNTESVFAALGKGGIIMPVLKGAFVGAEDNEVTCVLLRANHVTKMISVFVPSCNEVKEFAKEEFLAAWRENNGQCHTAFADDEQTYRPDVLRYEKIVLPEDLTELCEKMAEYAHDMWATERQSEGWTYGKKRDDGKLQTPDMVPYAQLPDSERMYDRNLSMGTLKLLYALGYKIVLAE